MGDKPVCGVGPWTTLASLTRPCGGLHQSDRHVGSQSLCGPPGDRPVKTGGSLYARRMQVIWAEHDGNLIEKLIGVMLCRRFPFANRIRPGQGDGGIDVMVPVGDGRVDIYQVKGFTGSLTPSQKGQVKDSLDRVAANANVTIRNWHLVVPVNPTPQLKFEWFEPLIANYDFDCHWFGLDHCEGLAATYPEVVRYYLGDGRHDLEQALADLRAISPLALSGQASGQLLTLQDLTEPFTAAVESINRSDPHFRYELMVTKHPPYSLTSPPPPQPDGLDVAAVVSQGREGRSGVVTILIFPRYAEALVDRPITGTFVLPVDSEGAPVDAAAASFLEFGAAGEFSVKHLTADLPGGLSEDATDVLVRVGPAVRDTVTPYELRLVTVDDQGNQLGEALCIMDPATAGVGTNPGIRVNGRSSSGLFDMQLPMRPGDETHSIRFKITGFAGKEPAAIQSDVWFLHSLASASSLRVGRRYGPTTSARIPVGETLPALFDERLVRLIDDLAVIQREAIGDLKLPELEGFDSETTRNIRIAATLLRGGGVRTTFERQPFTLPEDMAAATREQLGAPLLLEIDGHWQADILGRRVVVEPIVMRLQSAILSQDPDQDDLFVAVPAEFSNEMLIRRAPSP